MMFRHILAVSLMLFTIGLHGAENASARLVERVGYYPLLRDSYDLRLQHLLERELIKLNLHKATRGKQLAVALVDISNRRRPRVAEVNGDEMMYAASLPKVGILLAALVDVESGRLRLTPALKRSMTDMIRVSSNIEATRVMNMVGNRRVNEILASKRFRLYDPAVNGGLWVGKEYGKNPAFQRDPLHNLSHGATAMQVARMYYMLETGQLLGPRLTLQMKEMMSRPGIHHKFVKGLEGRNVEIFRKSGSWAHWHADSAIVESPRGDYILVGLAENAAGSEWLTKIASGLHSALFPQQIARN
jgi:beta-lactamase class A